MLVGTVNMQDPFAPEGSLYRLDPDGSLHELDTGYATANGIGISPDGRTVYVADQQHRLIKAYDYDTTKGTVGNRRVFASVPEADGTPRWADRRRRRICLERTLGRLEARALRSYWQDQAPDPFPRAACHLFCIWWQGTGSTLCYDSLVGLK